MKAQLAEAASRYEVNLEAVLPYLQSRGITEETARRFRLGYVETPLRGHDQFQGRLAISAIGPAGNIYSIRFRCLQPHNCGEVGCPKYLGMDGVPTRLFNVRAIAEASDTIALVEGELDAISCEQAGIPAVGVPGVTNWKRHHRRLLEGFRVLVVGDNDDAGKAFIKKVCGDVVSAQGVTLDHSVNDLNELLSTQGEAAVREALGVDQ